MADDGKFLELALELNLLDRVQASDCQIKQATSDSAASAAEICVAEGYLTPEQVDYIRDRQDQKVRGEARALARRVSQEFKAATPAAPEIPQDMAALLADYLSDGDVTAPVVTPEPAVATDAAPEPQAEPEPAAAIIPEPPPAAAGSNFDALIAMATEGADFDGESAEFGSDALTEGAGLEVGDPDTTSGFTAEAPAPPDRLEAPLDDEDLDLGDDFAQAAPTAAGVVDEAEFDLGGGAEPFEGLELGDSSVPSETDESPASTEGSSDAGGGFIMSDFSVEAVPSEPANWSKVRDSLPAMERPTGTGTPAVGGHAGGGMPAAGGAGTAHPTSGSAPAGAAASAAGGVAETPQLPAHLEEDDGETLLRPRSEHVPAEIEPGTGILADLLRRVSELGASDLHVHSGSRVMIRINGDMAPLDPDSEPWAEEKTEQAIAQLMGPKMWDRFQDLGDLDFAYKMPGFGRFRVNAYFQQSGPDIVFRLLPDEPPTLESLGLPAELLKFTEFRTGIVLCTGPIGCGKSSTLAAFLGAVNEARSEHIITVEDPIEFVFPTTHGLGLINQRQVGNHTASFARALKGALREDPDIISIGELRDRETISLAMTAAETGHFVLGSMHTASAVTTITRLINAFPANEQAQMRVMLSESLRAVITQRLVARADGNGRAVALEVLVVNRAVSNLIRDEKTFQIESVMTVGRSHGMRLLDISLSEMVEAGTITKEEACRHANDPRKFQ